MSKEEVIKYLVGKVKTLQIKLKDLDSEISRLTKERDGIAKAYDSYRYTLENESEDAAQVLNTTIRAKISQHDFSDLPIHRTAEIVLRDTARGMTTKELTEEIIKRGKKMVGPNAITIVNNSLRRFPDLFKKDGHVWTLILKEEGTKAA